MEFLKSAKAKMAGISGAVGSAALVATNALADNSATGQAAVEAMTQAKGDVDSVIGILITIVAAITVFGLVAYVMKKR